MQARPPSTLLYIILRVMAGDGGTYESDGTTFWESWLSWSTSGDTSGSANVNSCIPSAVQWATFARAARWLLYVAAVIRECPEWRMDFRMPLSSVLALVARPGDGSGLDWLLSTRCRVGATFSCCWRGVLLRLRLLRDEKNERSSSIPELCCCVACVGIAWRATDQAAMMVRSAESGESPSCGDAAVTR